MCYALDSILYRVCKIIHGIYAPLISCIVMTHVGNPVYDRISHVDIGARHIYFCPQNLLSVGVFAVFHILEKFEIFFHGAVSVRTVFARCVKCSPVFFYLIGGKIAYKCFSLFDKLNRSLIHLVKIVRCKKQPVLPVCSEPFNIRFYRIHKFRFLFGRISIIKSQIKLAAVLFCKSVIDKYGLGMSYMKISVGLGWKTGMYLIIFSFLKILVDYHFDKIFGISLFAHRLSFTHYLLQRFINAKMCRGQEVPWEHRVRLFQFFLSLFRTGEYHVRPCDYTAL